jgi:16S rRNA (uracil1498-N3)-methyltransferase
MSSVPRFFVPPEAIAEGIVILPSDAAHHARNVLRLRPGEAVTIHDGTGMRYACRLAEVTPAAVTAAIETAAPADTEPSARITVAQALPRTPEKVEQVLQHGTEIGAAGFVLFGARRSVAKIESGDKLVKRLERWRAIVRGAAEQSGRAVLPSVAWLPASTLLADTFSDYSARLILHESASVPLRTALETEAAVAERLLIVVGPEGGLADDEVEKFEVAGGISVSLGPRVLRTETAALVAVSQILFARGDECRTTQV